MSKLPSEYYGEEPINGQEKQNMFDPSTKCLFSKLLNYECGLAQKYAHHVISVVVS